MNTKYKDYLKHIEGHGAQGDQAPPSPAPFISVRSKELNNELRELTIALIQAGYSEFWGAAPAAIKAIFKDQVQRAKDLQELLREQQLGESLAGRLEHTESILRKILVVENMFPAGFIQEVKLYFKLDSGSGPEKGE